MTTKDNYMHEEVQKYLSERGKNMYKAKLKKHGRKGLKKLLSKAGKSKKGCKQSINPFIV